MLRFIIKQLNDIIKGDIKIFKDKILIIYPHIIWIPLYLFFIPFIFIIKIISFFYIIRFEKLKSGFIGDVTQAVELYLCEKKFKINALNKPYLDIFFPDGSICNKDLFKIFKRNITILPKLFIYPLYFLAKTFPGFSVHVIGNNSQSDRDINNLYDETDSFFKFNEYEEKIGKNFLNSLKIPDKSKFICLNVREGEYHKKKKFHNYRNGNMDNYILACEELTKLGYYIFRLGSKAVKPMKTNNKMIIDYALNGMRTEFLDLYLGSKCSFCISTSSGIDSIPIVSRKPMLFITVPIGYFYTFSNQFMSLTKHHIDIKSKKRLSLKEIFERGVGYSLDTNEFTNKNVFLLDNSPYEIKNAAIEFHNKLLTNFNISDKEKILEKKFWEMYGHHVNSHYKNGKLLHGKFKSNICFSNLNKNFFID